MIVGELRRYRRRTNTAVTAVRIDLDTDGFTYRKWGFIQRCKPGDWLVDNQGEVYTVDHESFVKTYQSVAPGRYVKHGLVWARVAFRQGTIQTKEGQTCYNAGDFVVFNDRNATDGYAISSNRFHVLYEPDDEEPPRISSDT